MHNCVMMQKFKTLAQNQRFLHNKQYKKPSVLSYPRRLCVAFTMLKFPAVKILSADRDLGSYFPWGAFKIVYYVILSAFKLNLQIKIQLVEGTVAIIAHQTMPSLTEPTTLNVQFTRMYTSTLAMYCASMALAPRRLIFVSHP